VTTRRGDLGELPAGVLTREEAAVGQVLRVSLGAGQALRADLLKRESVIRTGQQVKLISRGAGFAVSTDGQAMNNAADGQLARVRTSAGQTISGIARAGGMVEVTH
jgi:flagella basal body P-ring formation protein FlgA